VKDPKSEADGIVRFPLRCHDCEGFGRVAVADIARRGQIPARALIRVLKGERIRPKTGLMIVTKLFDAFGAVFG